VKSSVPYQGREREICVSATSAIRSSSTGGGGGISNRNDRNDPGMTGIMIAARKFKKEKI